MRRHAVTMLLSTAIALGFGKAEAGGPLIVLDDGEPAAWSTATEIQYRTDNGPLSDSVDEPAARSRVIAQFNVWENIDTASIAFDRAGFIEAAGGDFTGGDVDTIDEYNAVSGSCNAQDQNPIIYDDDGTIFEELGLEDDVIGFAGPCAFNPGTGQILSGKAVMNGLFQDGEPGVPDLSAALFDATLLHEFGHFSGLSHSQVNKECVDSICSSDDTLGVPTMFAFAVTDEMESLSIDDIGWISRLYPSATFATSHGTISGTVYFSDGESHAQLVNVVARQVATPGGEDESRTMAASGVSGYRFRFFNGNPITEPEAGGGGSQNPAHIGFYEISVPAGSYTIEVESVIAEFVDAGVGGPIRIAMPGTAPPPIGPIVVTAGGESAGNDFVLNGTPPRFDQFEGP
jgi:hypothetical protein